MRSFSAWNGKKNDDENVEEMNLKNNAIDENKLKNIIYADTLSDAISTVQYLVA